MLKIVFPLISLFLLTRQISNIKNLIFYITSTRIVLTPIVFMGRLDYITCFSDIWKTDLLRTPLIRLRVWIIAIITIASNSVYYNIDRTKTFTLTVIILTVALLIAFFTRSLFNFFIFFETSLIPTLFLILGWGYQPERTQAGLYLILYTITARLPLLILIAHLIKINRHTTIIFYILFPIISKTAPYTYIIILVGAFIV
jgi:NADH-ubiquinone oxidoreductase chain 4